MDSFHYQDILCHLSHVLMVLMNFQFYNPNRKHLKKNLVLNSNWILDNSSLETIVSFAAVFKVVTQRSFPKGDKIGCELQKDVDTL